jgi:hypothetical protein
MVVPFWDSASFSWQGILIREICVIRGYNLGCSAHRAEWQAGALSAFGVSKTTRKLGEGEVEKGSRRGAEARRRVWVGAPGATGNLPVGSAG